MQHLQHPIAMSKSMEQVSKWMEQMSKLLELFQASSKAHNIFQ
jgi:hypothetical protein